jgi:hypothetical protein
MQFLGHFFIVNLVKENSPILENQMYSLEVITPNPQAENCDFLTDYLGFEYQCHFCSCDISYLYLY